MTDDASGTKKILIAGYYGAGNAGDEAILAAMLDDLRDLAPGISATVLSWDPVHTRQAYGVRAVHWQDIRGLLDAIQGMDAVIVGGGGIFQDYWDMDPDSYLRRQHGGITSYGSLPLLAKLVGIPCMLYSVGVGPLRGEQAREHTRRIFEMVRIATLRDEHSYQALLETGFEPREHPQLLLETHPDPAFGLSLPDQTVEEARHQLRNLGIDPDRPLLGVNLRYWDRPLPPPEWLPPVTRGLQAFLDHHPQMQVLLLPFQQAPEDRYTDDLAVLREVEAGIEHPGQRCLYRKDLAPRRVQALLGQCDLVLGMRLHALILALNESVPVAALPYDRKVSSLMEEIGLQAWCLPTYHPAADELAGLLDAAWQQRGELREAAGKIARTYAGRARGSADLAGRLLGEEPAKPPRSFLQEFALQRVAQIEGLDLALAKERRFRETLQDRVAALEGELTRRQAELDDIRSSQTWQLAQFFQRIRHGLVPPGSGRERLLKGFWRRLKGGGGRHDA